MPSELILASRSPRRTGLLTRLGVEFRQVVSGVSEVHEGSDHAASAGAAALVKADAVARNHPGAVVIGADTVVVSPDGELLGKPADVESAIGILMKLSGKPHTVFTGVAVIGPGRDEVSVATEETRVVMRAFGREEAARYVASGEPMDKAGAYGIQVRGALLVERVEGCYFNVVGLPLNLLRTMLEEHGVETRSWIGPEQAETPAGGERFNG
ncbi:Maf family protein [Gemmatimonadota bacterium]